MNAGWRLLGKVDNIYTFRANKSYLGMVLKFNTGGGDEPEESDSDEYVDYSCIQVEEECVVTFNPFRGTNSDGEEVGDDKDEEGKDKDPTGNGGGDGGKDGEDAYPGVVPSYQGDNVPFAPSSILPEFTPIYVGGDTNQLEYIVVGSEVTASLQTIDTGATEDDSAGLDVIANSTYDISW